MSTVRFSLPPFRSSRRTGLLLLVLLLAACLAAPAQQEMFGTGEYARDRNYNLEHISLDISFDYLNRRVMGMATLRIEPFGDGLREVDLDSAVNVESVTLGGARGAKPTPLAFRATGQKLYVTLDKPHNSGNPFELVIKYNAQPKKGLFFITPDKNHPNGPHEIWSQGEAMDNHYWFPCYDFPNDRLTSEMRVTVPANWEAVSNGRLESVQENKVAGTHTFHWVQEKPHSTYLISLVAGDFEKVEEKTKNNVSLSFYVPSGTSAEVPAAFGRTADMVEFYSQMIVPYPWPKYAQSAVEDFVAGGMENTSATTVNRSWLVERQLAPDLAKNNDDGVAHELAHQWFGDLVTTADWRNLWLNEGFATYFANLWEEHYYGRDQFDWTMLRTERQIVQTPHIQDFPIVWRPNSDAGPFETLIYPKAAFVLHMIRHELGDDLWWKAIQHYVKKFSYQNVQTHDFIEAVAEATGHNFESLFAQYVYGPGFPEFALSWDYNPQTRLVHVVVSQTLKRDGKPALFNVPVDFELLSDSGTTKYTVHVAKETEHFYFPAEQRPRTVLFDPTDSVLKTADFRKDESEWIYQLLHGQRPLNRMEAAIAMRKLASSPALLSALEQACTVDKFVGVRVEAAQTLGTLKAETSRFALLKMLDDTDGQARRAAISALSHLKADDATTARLLRIGRSDPSIVTRAAAIRAYGELKPKDALDNLMPLMTVDSSREYIRAAAISAIAAQGDDKSLSLLMEWAQPDKPEQARQAAVSGLAHIGKGKTEVRDLLVECLREDDEHLRFVALSALSQRKETSAMGAIEQVAAGDSMLAGMARRTLVSLREASGQPNGTARPARASAGDSAPGNTVQLQKRIDELEKENREVKARLERLENVQK